MLGIDGTARLSEPNHSTVGVGFPRAEQSTRPPLEFVNSTFEGGSLVNIGPCVSYDDPALTFTAEKKKQIIMKVLT